MKIFRKTGHKSFAVQSSSASGVVEIHCNKVDAKPSKQQVDKALARLSTMGGSVADGSGGWSIRLVELGMYCSKLKGFTGCHVEIVAPEHLVDIGSQEHDPEVSCIPVSKRSRKMTWAHSACL